MASKAILSLQLSRSPPCSRTNPNPSSSLPPSRRLLAPLFVKSRRRLKLRPLTASAASSQAAPVDRSHLDSLERCLSISQDSGMPTCSAERSLSAPPPMGKKGRGTALSITLEKSKTDTQTKKKRKPPEVYKFIRCYLFLKLNSYSRLLFLFKFYGPYMELHSCYLATV